MHRIVLLLAASLLATALPTAAADDPSPVPSHIEYEAVCVDNDINQVPPVVTVNPRC